MKYWKIPLLILSFAFFQIAESCGQKRSLKAEDLEVWPTVMSRNPGISSDGKFAFFTESGLNDGTSRLMFKAIGNTWSKGFINGEAAVFTRDSKQAIFLQPKGRLCILELGGNGEQVIPNVQRFELFMLRNKEYLIYTKQGDDAGVILATVKGNPYKVFKHTTGYYLSKNRATLIIKSNLDDKQVLELVDLTSLKQQAIWKGEKVANIVMDEVGRQLVFMTGEKLKKIWYYKQGDENPTELTLSAFSGFDKGYEVRGINRFNKDGSGLFFTIETANAAVSENTGVVIWGYYDSSFPTKKNKPESNARTALLNLRDHKIVQLQKEGEKISFYEDINDDFAFLTYAKGNILENHWNKQVQFSSYVINCGTGKRVSCPIAIPYGLSPNGGTLLGIDQSDGSILAYRVLDGVSKNVSDKIPSFAKEGLENRDPYGKNSFLFAGWSRNGAGVLLYDKFDLWEVSLTKDVDAVCLTKGYGRTNNIVFRIAEKMPNQLYEGGQLILTAFNKASKKNGFYRLELNKSLDLSLLIMDDFLYQIVASGFPSFTPMKATKASQWLVRRESAERSPNYFCTSDFRKFTQVSSLYPESSYHWLTNELVNYFTEDKKPVQGILYKPEDFDPNKKYPLIIHYYEEKSDFLNVYLRPDLPSDNINIPWFVSRGYIVFTPDIFHQIAKPGEGGLASVIAAAKTLSQFPYVDPGRIGIQGHSFGGYETNYIITHSRLFAAAMAASAPSDLISNYGLLNANTNRSQTSAFERGQFRMKNSIWEGREDYIKSSPIFNADQVTTPLLMMNNENDGGVPISQGIEFFNALRRLGKKVWLLQYPNEGHSISGSNKISRLDYMSRMDMFFDHYLKGTSIPEWMMQPGQRDLSEIK